MQLTRFTDYGLRVLMYLAARPADTSMSKSSPHITAFHETIWSVTPPFTTGHINTTKGKGGGIQIADGTDAQRIGDLTRTGTRYEHRGTFCAKTNQCRITDHRALKHFLHEATQNFLIQ